MIWPFNKLKVHYTSAFPFDVDLEGRPILGTIKKYSQEIPESRAEPAKPDAPPAIWASNVSGNPELDPICPHCGSHAPWVLQAPDGERSYCAKCREAEAPGPPEDG